MACLQRQAKQVEQTTPGGGVGMFRFRRDRLVQPPTSNPLSHGGARSVIVTDVESCVRRQRGSDTADRLFPPGE